MRVCIVSAPPQGTTLPHVIQTRLSELPASLVAIDLVISELMDPDLPSKTGSCNCILSSYPSPIPFLLFQNSN